MTEELFLTSEDIFCAFIIWSGSMFQSQLVTTTGLWHMTWKWKKTPCQQKTSRFWNFPTFEPVVDMSTTCLQHFQLSINYSTIVQIYYNWNYTFPKMFATFFLIKTIKKRWLWIILHIQFFIDDIFWYASQLLLSLLAYLFQHLQSMGNPDGYSGQLYDLPGQWGCEVMIVLLLLKTNVYTIDLPSGYRPIIVSHLPLCI